MFGRGSVPAPLALPASGEAAAFQARFDSDLVLTLPYADSESLPEGWRERAEALVGEEV